MPWYRSEDRVMRLAGVGNRDLPVFCCYRCLPPDEVPVELWGITKLEPPQVLGEHRIEGVGHHRHDDIEVHLHEDRGREAVEMEERDRFRYGVLHPPPAGIGGDDNFDRSIEIVRDEIGGVLVSVVP